MLSESNIRDVLLPDDPDKKPDPTPAGLASKWIAALAVVLILVWGGSVALILHFENSSPRVPAARTGHVYRFKDSRRVVYLTRNEHWSAEAALAIPVLATLGAAWFAFRRGDSSARADD